MDLQLADPSAQDVARHPLSHGAQVTLFWERHVSGIPIELHKMYRAS